jgi:hypothetical protein
MQLLPICEQQFLNDTGAPLANGKVYFYESSAKLTLATTWRDVAGGTSNANPVVLDSAGRAVIWGNRTYYQVVEDASGAVVFEGAVGSSDWVSVLDFGANGDGNDDTAAFCAASMTGKRVLLPKPTVAYGISANIPVGRGMEGDGWSSVTIRALTADACLVLGSLGQLRNVRFDGNNVATVGVMVAATANRVMIKEVRVENCAGDGIQLINTQNSTLLDCEVQNCGRYQFHLIGTENCKLICCNSNLATGSAPEARGLYAEAYLEGTPPRNITVLGGIYERGQSDYQVQIDSCSGFFDFIDAEINSGAVAGIQWAARSDSVPGSGGSLSLSRVAFTMNGSGQVAVDGLSSNLEYFVDGYVMSGAGGRIPLSLLLGTATVDQSRARAWFETSFEQSSEGWVNSGTGGFTYNADTRAIDCTSSSPAVGVRRAPGAFAAQFSMAGRIAIVECYVSALSGASSLALGISTTSSSRPNLAALSLGYNKVFGPLQRGDIGVLIGAPTASTFSLRWVKAVVL